MSEVIGADQHEAVKASGFDLLTTSFFIIELSPTPEAFSFVHICDGSFGS